MTRICSILLPILILICTLLTLKPADAAGDRSASISLGMEYSSGTYGTPTETRSIYAPLTASWFPGERYDISVEIPFVYQNNSNVTTDLFRSSQQPSPSAKTVPRGGPGGSRGTILQSASGGSGGTTSANATSSSVSGLGDILVRLGAIGVHESERLPQIRPHIFVKFPTASSSDGLGTGKYDAGGGIELTKWFGDLHTTGECIFNYQGKAPGFGLKNYVSYTAGIGYQITDSLEPMLAVKGATPPSDYSTELMELRARIIWDVSSSTSLDLYGAYGIADSSPDYGSGLSVVFYF